MVYTHDLKSCGESLVGSSPTPGTYKHNDHVRVVIMLIGTRTPERCCASRRDREAVARPRSATA